MRTIRQVIPEEQVQILIEALRVYRFAVDSITEGEDERSKGFDTIGLEGLLHGKVVIEMTVEEKEGFGKHGVDYPEFVDESPNALWARKCSVTGQGMNAGWIWESAGFYVKDMAVAAAEVVKDWYKGQDRLFNGDDPCPVNGTAEEILSWAHGEEICYWTEWEDDFQYIEINGQLKEIEL